jgi:hypothetical protein
VSSDSDPCRVCGAAQRPMCFAGLPYCSDRCRKKLYLETLDEAFRVSGEEAARALGLKGSRPSAPAAEKGKSTGGRRG